MWIKSNGTYRQVGQDTKTSKKLPVGNYLLDFDERSETYYLTELDEISLPSKLYGSDYKISERYLKSFDSSDKSMGILLAGQKGTGKSVTAKYLCKISNMPVINITSVYYGEDFIEFLSKIENEVIIFIDEFEKIYDNEDQMNLLSILDGFSQKTKKLWLMTSNSLRISPYMLNRPGRIRYVREYDRLDEDTMIEIIDDRLINKSHKDELITKLKFIYNISIDQVISLIDEMNLFNEGVEDSLPHLNIKMECNYYEVNYKSKDGEVVESYINYNPFDDIRRGSLCFNWTDENGYCHYDEDMVDLEITPKSNYIELKDKEGGVITLTPSTVTKINF